MIENDEADLARKENRQPVTVASIITVRKGDEKRHFTVRDGKAEECRPYQEAWADRLFEKHPTKQIHRYCIHWGGYEADYRPASATQLAKARAKREVKAVEKEAESAPLFSQQILEEGYVPPRRKGRGR